MMKTNLKTVLLATGAAALAMGMTIVSANALPSVNSRLFAGAQLLSDNSAEYLIKGANNTQENIVEEGDLLRGIFSIDTTEQGSSSVNIGGTGTPVSNELTGIFEIEITGKTGGPSGGGSTCGLSEGNCWSFTFGPSASFAAEVVSSFGWTEDAPASGKVAGAAVAFFEDLNGNDFNRQIDTGFGNEAIDIANMEATAIDGGRFWLAGFGSLSDYWFAFTSTDDIAAGGNTPTPANFGSFNMAQTLLDRELGPELLDVDCLGGPTDFCGSGSLLGKANSSYDSFDDVNFAVNVIPEPATLGLMGIGLLAIGAISRRRKAA